MWVDFIWEREVGRWSEFPVVMAGVAAHEDERGRRNTGEGGHVSSGVARRIEEVKAAVPKIVRGFEVADLQISCEIQLLY